MFDRAHFARFLVANDFDLAKAISHFNEYLNWRKQQKIDSLLVCIVSSHSYRNLSSYSTRRSRSISPMVSMRLISR